MVKKAFTLIEMIFVIIILSIIVTGGLLIAEKIYKRNLIASEYLNLSFNTEQTIDKLANMLYYRVPLTAIGYNPKNGNYKYIGYINNSNKYKVFEWISQSFDIEHGLNFSGFDDLYASKKPVLKALDFNVTDINETLQNKFNTNEDFTNLVGIIFAGSFDRGGEGALSDYNDSFGWHGGKAKYIYIISKYTYNKSDNDANLTLKDANGSDISNARIFSKFYLVDTAYAIARGADINTSAPCIKNLNIPNNEINNTLFLFYNYRPWKGETFCADNYGNRDGNVSVLSQHIAGFYIKAINSHLEIFFHALYKKGNITVGVAKQKVVF